MNCHWGGFTGGKWQWNITEQTVLTDAREKERKTEADASSLPRRWRPEEGKGGWLPEMGEGVGGWIWIEAGRGAARRRVAVDRAPKIGEEICELVGGVRWWQAEQTRSTDGLRAGP
jgi:hypothetical protein